MDMHAKDGFVYVPTGGSTVPVFECEAVACPASDEETSETASATSFEGVEMPERVLYDDKDMQDKSDYLRTGQCMSRKSKYWRRDTKRYYSIDADGNMLVKKQQRKKTGAWPINSEQSLTRHDLSCGHREL
jgi:hypothetical protein